MAFNYGTNPDTGQPFTSPQEAMAWYNQRVAAVGTEYLKKYRPVVDTMVGLMGPNVNRDAATQQVARIMAHYGPPPADKNQMKDWARGFSKMYRETVGREAFNEWGDMARRLHTNPRDLWVRVQEAYTTGRFDINDPAHAAFKAWKDKYGDMGVQSTMNQLNGSGAQPLNAGDIDEKFAQMLQEEADVNPDYGIDPTTGSMGKKSIDERMQEFYDNLYSKESQERLSNAAGTAAARNARRRGIVGEGLSDLAVAKAGASAAADYETAINQAKTNALGMMANYDVNMQNLAAQERDRIYNSQMARYGAQQQQGGSIGGIIGGIVGALPALIPGGQGIAAFTSPALAAAGTGIGTASVGGPATRGFSSLARSSTGKKYGGGVY